MRKKKQTNFLTHCSKQPKNSHFLEKSKHSQTKLDNKEFEDKEVTFFCQQQQ